MSYVPPCADPANDPEDWFIEKDGKQYPDEDLQPDDIKAALVRRRHAKDKCYTHCVVREACLGDALETGEQYGTRGSYYPEELKVIRDGIEERRQRAGRLD